MLTEYSRAYKPFQYPWAVELTKLHEKIHWVEDEVSLEDDVSDWKRGKLSDNEKLFITQILRLFTQQDVCVGQYYYEKFIPIFKNNEIRCMLGSFAAREATHMRGYALLNDTLGLPEEEYSAFLEYKEMSNKVDFMLDADIHSKTGIGLALAKSVFNEGVGLFASFAMLLNFQRRGLMKGMGKIVEWSIKDETVHFEAITLLFKEFIKEHARIVDDEFKGNIYEMAKQAVKLEDKFIDLAFSNFVISGLSAEEIKQYIRYIADRRLLQLGLKTKFKVKDNPIVWLEHIINGLDHTNFFENRVTEYSVGGMKGDWRY